MVSERLVENPRTGRGIVFVNAFTHHSPALDDKKRGKRAWWGISRREGKRAWTALDGFWGWEEDST